jgi:hypothetical protein
MHCPQLAFIGTREDVGKDEDLRLFRSSVQRQRGGPNRADMLMIRNADPMYVGEAAQVAQEITDWLDSVGLAQSCGVSGKREQIGIMLRR